MSGFNNILQDYKVNENKTYSGFYRAIVRNSYDPTETDSGDKILTGRVQVEVLPMMKDIIVEDLPWATQCYTQNSTYVPQEGETVWVFFENDDIYKPVIFGMSHPIQDQGDDLENKVEDGEHPHKTDVIGDIQEHHSTSESVHVDHVDKLIPDHSSAILTNETIPEYKSEYPYNCVHKSPSGIIVEVDDTVDDTDPESIISHKTYSISHPSGSYIRMEADGSIHIHTESNTQIFTQDNTTIRSEGTLKVHSVGDMSIHTVGNMGVNASGTMAIHSGGDMTIHSDTHIGMTAPMIDIN